ncbi:unnamed protein product, partial [Amoebophrya sp. A25]|eukprot:GSA25T00010870001.1
MITTHNSNNCSTPHIAIPTLDIDIHVDGRRKILNTHLVLTCHSRRYIQIVQHKPSHSFVLS